MTRLLRVCVFVGLVIALAACQTSGDAEVGQAEDGTLRVGPTVVADTVTRAVAPGERTLVIDGFTGDVVLRGTDATTADLTFVKRGRGDDTDAATDALSGVTVTESGTQDAYTFRLESDEDDRSAVDVRGTVPRETTLRVEHASGAVRITGLSGALTVRHQYGPVEIDEAAGPVDVAIKTGDVTARFRSIPRTASVTLRTANGDVRLGVPPGASIQVDAETNVGVVQTHGLSMGPQRLTPVHAGARYAAQMGAGDAVVELRTENGNVILDAVDAPETADTTSVRPDTAREDAARGDTVGTGPETAPPDTTGASVGRRVERPPTDTLRTPSDTAPTVAPTPSASDTTTRDTTTRDTTAID